MQGHGDSVQIVLQRVGVKNVAEYLCYVVSYLFRHLALQNFGKYIEFFLHNCQLNCTRAVQPHICITKKATKLTCRLRIFTISMPAKLNLHHSQKQSCLELTVTQSHRPSPEDRKLSEALVRLRTREEDTVNLVLDLLYPHR